MTGRRYVILHHTGHGEPHFDLMLEIDATGPLLTWRLSDWPPGATTVVTPLPAHRRHYLTHEGEVGGGRGVVRRVEEGVYLCEAVGPAGLRISIGPNRLVPPSENT